MRLPGPDPRILDTGLDRQIEKVNFIRLVYGQLQQIGIAALDHPARVCGDELADLLPGGLHGPPGWRRCGLPCQRVQVQMSQPVPGTELLGEGRFARAGVAEHQYAFQRQTTPVRPSRPAAPAGPFSIFCQ